MVFTIYFYASVGMQCQKQCKFTMQTDAQDQHITSHPCQISPISSENSALSSLPSSMLIHTASGGWMGLLLHTYFLNLLAGHLANVHTGAVLGFPPLFYHLSTRLSLPSVLSTRVCNMLPTSKNLVECVSLHCTVCYWTCFISRMTHQPSAVRSCPVFVCSGILKIFLPIAYPVAVPYLIYCQETTPSKCLPSFTL